MFGIDVRLVRNIRRSNTKTWEQKQDAMWRPFTNHLNVRTVVDVGANSGQFATIIHRQCPEAKIISFEPLATCHEELFKVLSEIPGSQMVKAAAGEKTGTAQINESEFSPCSSLLPGTDLLGEDYQSAAVTKSIDVPVVRLDDTLIIDDLVDDVLVKFDVQGFEIQAIRGAEALLKKAKIIICEVCFFRTMYKGQPLFHEIYEELRGRGFTYMGNAEYLKRKRDGRNVEADAVSERLFDSE